MEIKLEIVLKDLIDRNIYPSKSWKHPFMNFKTLVYELTTWKTNRELIKERNILKWDKIIDYLYQKEKDKIPKIEEKIIHLLNKWYMYKDIKPLLINKTKYE